MIQMKLNNEQIEDKIQHLTSVQPPIDYIVVRTCRGAYNPPMPYTFTYYCQTCGKKTIFAVKDSDIREQVKKELLKIKEKTNNKFAKSDIKYIGYCNFKYNIYSILKDIEIYRQEVEKITAITVTLCESDFCKHCSPSIKKRKLYLSININGSQHYTTTPNVSLEDIQILNEFLNDENIHQEDGLIVAPLVYYLDIIKKMLGKEDITKREK